MPRIINVICDAALVFGYAEQRRNIDRSLLEEVIAELEVTGVLLPPASAKTGSRARVSGNAAAVLADPRPAATHVEQGLEEHILAAPEPLIQTREVAAASEKALERERELLKRRLAEVAVREEVLAQRERQLAQQQHIMSEEYRLLRQQRAERTPGSTTDQVGARTGTESRGVAKAQPSAPFWQRIVRLFGREAALRS